jgi:hypothetical protein
METCLGNYNNRKKQKKLEAFKKSEKVSRNYEELEKIAGATKN